MGVEYVRRWPDLARRLAQWRGAGRRLRQQGLRGQGRPVARAVTVADRAILPLLLHREVSSAQLRVGYQGAAEAILGAAGSEGRAAILPLHSVRPGIG